MSILRQAIDNNRRKTNPGSQNEAGAARTTSAALPEPSSASPLSGQSRLRQAIDSTRRGEVVLPQPRQDNESAGTSKPAYGGIQNTMNSNAQETAAPVGAAMSAAAGGLIAKTAGPELARQQDNNGLESLRQRAEELEAQYRQISQEASRSRYRKYGSERAEAEKLWRAAREEYEQAAAKLGLAKPSFGERVLKTLSGAGKQYLGSAWDAAGAVMPNGTAVGEVYQEQLESLYGEKQRTEEWLKQPEDEAERRQLENRLASINEQIAVYEASVRANEGVSDAARDAAAEITQSGAADLERAKTGATAAGRLLVDAGAAGAQMLGDAALGAVTGFGSMAPMLVRSFGGGSQQAREKGYSQKQQIAMGFASAVTEYFSEKLFGGNPVYDSDAGLVSKLVGKVTENETLLNYLASKPAEMLYEGLEEVTADILEPLAEQIIAGQHDDVTLEQIIEDGLVGIILAGAGQGGQKIVNTAAQGISTRRAGNWFNNLGDDAVRSVVQEGLDSDPSTQSYKLAQQLQQKLDRGENISAAELGQLYQNNVQAIDAEENSDGLLEQAAEELANDGRVTNSTARDILESPSARATLETATGLSITEDMTKSQQRAAVKSAVESLASRDNGADTAAATNNTARGPAAQTAAQARPVAQQAYDAARIRRAASALGENGAKALAAAYDGSTNADSFYAGFAAYYEAGMSGMDMGKVQSVYSGQLNEAQRYAAYAAGQNDAAASLAAEREGVKFVTAYGKEAGLIRNDNAAKIPRKTAVLYNSLAKATGVKIELVDSIQDADGNAGAANGIYLPGRNTIQIAMDAERPLNVVAAHEVTHRMQELAPEAYRKYRDYAVNALTELAESPTARIEKYKALYAERGTNLTTEQAMDEIAADFTRGMVEDAGLFERLALEDRSVARRVLDALKEFVEKVKRIFKGDTEAQNNAAIERYGADIATLEEAARLWNTAMKAAQKQAKTIGNTENAARTDGAARYSIKYDQNNNPYVVIETDILAGVPRSEWVRTVKDNLRAKFPEGVTLGSNVIQITGKSRGEMTFSKYMQSLMRTAPDLFANKLRATNNTDEILRAARNWVNEALLHPRKDDIIDFARGEVLLSVGGNDYTANVIVGNRGNNGLLLYDIIDLVPAEIPERIRKTDAAYTAAPTKGHHDRQATPDNVILAQDVGDVNLTGKKASDVVKLEQGKTKSDAAIVKNPSLGTGRSTASGFEDSIGQSGGKVKGRFSLKSDSMGRALTKEQQEYFKDSKVVDDQGRLKVVYHGSPSDFNEFSPRYLGTNGTAEGYGFYFTDSREVAEAYSHGTEAQRHQGADGRLFEVYLNITKPLSGERVTMTRAEFRRFLREMNKQVDEDGEPLEFLSNYGDVSYDGLNAVINEAMRIEYDGSDNDINMIHSIINGNGNMETVFDVLRRTTGFDGIIVTDASWGGDQTIYVAFHSNEVKNVTNKKPTTSPDIRYSLKGGEKVYNRTAILEESTIDAYLRDYAAKSSPKYAQAYITYMTPSAFLSLTTSKTGRSVIEQESKPLNAAELGEASRRQPIQLRIDHENGEVTGHEGRHRANAMLRAGIENIPVLLFDSSNKYSKEAIGELLLHGQVFGNSRSTATEYVHDLVPLSYENRDAIVERFATPPSMERIRNRYYGSENLSYSLKGSGNIQREMAALQKENQALRERVDYWKGQTKRTERVTTDKKAVAKMARELIRSFGADVRVEDIQGDLQAFCDYIANGSDGKDELTYTEARRRAEAIAQTLVENAVAVDDDGYRQYNDLREYLRTTGIVYGKEYHGDIADFGAFRRGLFGKLNLKTKGQTNIDKVYQEMAYQWPEFFDEQIQSHPTEQLLRIAEVLDGIYNVTEYNPFSNNMEEAVTYAANEIMEGFFDLPQTRATFADRQARKLDDAKAKGRQQAQRIREQDNARMDKLRAQNKERIQRIRERERARRDAKIEQLKSDYRARDAAGRERRNARETRARIARHAKELSQKLLRPSDKQHIPENLRQGVAALLEAINLESQYTIDPETGKRKKTDSGLPTKRTEAFLKLKAQYAEIARSGEGLVIDPALFGDAAEGIQGSFDAVIAMGETRLEDMNSRQLETVWQVLKAVEHSVSSAGKVLSRAKYERTSEWAKALQTDSKGRKPKRPLSKKHAALDLETPYTFFSHYGEAGKAVYRMLRDAQDRQQVLVNRIAEAAGKIADSKLVRQLEKNARSYTTQGGEELTLSDAQLMELYLLDKRPQGREHLLGNGVYQPEVKSRHIRRGNKSIRLTPEDLSALTGMLTPEQKKVADKLQALTAGLLADMGNEASMTAYGYKKFVEEHYWPIRSAREEVHSSVEKGGDRPRSIKNTGFAQQLQPQANNAVDIGSVFDTFSDHAAGMTEYAAWLCPMEDAGRLFNHKFTVEDADGKMHTTGENVKNLLDRAGGTGARQYWERLMEDIQNGIRAKSDSPMWDYATKSISGFKGAAVGANVRVILQQPTAFFRAGAVLNPVDMAAALTAGWAKGSGWKKALKWSPIAMRKDNGSFDISSPASMKDTLFDQRSGVQKVNDALSAPAGWADAVTWGVLWNACENQTARTHKELAKGSDAFYRETARTFAEVIDQTQVVDGVLQRSNIMRSSNAVVQQATSFMGEPIMSLNLMMRSWDNFRYEQDKVKRGKAIKVMGRSALALTVTAAVNALAQSLVDGIRDDDRDKKYWERVISAFTGLTGDEESGWDKTKALTAGNFGSNLNIVGQIPFAKDVLSLAQGYSVSRTEAEVVEDLIAAGEMTVEAAQGGKYTPQYAAAETLAAAAKLFGTPVGNIKRDVLGFYRSALIEADNIPAQYELEKAIYNLGSVRNKGRYYDLLYKALELEDMDSYWHIRADLMENMGLDGKSLDSAMKSRYAKQLEKDSGYTLPRQAQDLIGIRESRGDGDSDDSVGFTAKDLAPKEYQRYASERAESYRAVADELEGFSTFRSLDGTVRDKALSAADSLTEKLALEAVSGGAYAADTKWMLWATGGGDAGVSEAEAILFKVAYDMTEGDKDPDTGKTVSGSKKENVLEAAAEMMPWLTDRELDYLMGNYWK